MLQINYKKCIKVWAYTILISFFIVYDYVFLIAYFNSCKCTNIYIDKFGEANLELILLITGTIAILLTFYWWWQEKRRR